MKLALITEGLSEFKSLPLFYDQLRTRTGNEFMKPLFLACSPDAPPQSVARHCKATLLIAQAKGADLALVILDREQQDDCPGKVAEVLESAISKKCSTMKTLVVLKDRAFENWLIADVDSLAAQPARFKVTQAIRRAIEPNKADRCDGEEIFSRLTAHSDSYNKTVDSERICRRADITKIAANSRSFRHFLHAAGDSTYGTHCKKP